MLERKRPATYQDVLDAPEHQVAELLDGELFLSRDPADRTPRQPRCSVPSSSLRSATDEAARVGGSSSTGPSFISARR